MKLVVKETKLTEAPATTPAGYDTAVPTGAARPANRGLFGKIRDFFMGDAGVGGALKKRDAAKKLAKSQGVDEAHANAIQKQADMLAKKHKGDIKKIMAELKPFIVSSGASGASGDPQSLALAFAGAAVSTIKDKTAKAGQQPQAGQQGQPQLNQPQFAQLMVPQVPGQQSQPSGGTAPSPAAGDKAEEIKAQQVSAQFLRSPQWNALIAGATAAGGAAGALSDPAKKRKAAEIALKVFEKMLQQKPDQLHEADATPATGSGGVLNIKDFIKTLIPPGTPARGTRAAVAPALEDAEIDALANAIKEWFKSTKRAGGSTFIGKDVSIVESTLFAKRGNQFVLKG